MEIKLNTHKSPRPNMLERKTRLAGKTCGSVGTKHIST